MAISGRFVLLALAGLVPVMLFPGWGTVLLVCLALCALLVLDLAAGGVAPEGHAGPHFAGQCHAQRQAPNPS